MFHWLDVTFVLLAARVHLLLSGQRGQTLAEYSILMAVIAVGVTVTGMIVFRDALGGAFNSAAACIDGC